MTARSYSCYTAGSQLLSGLPVSLLLWSGVCEERQHGFNFNLLWICLHERLTLEWLPFSHHLPCSPQHLRMEPGFGRCLIQRSVGRASAVCWTLTLPWLDESNENLSGFHPLSDFNNTVQKSPIKMSMGYTQNWTPSLWPLCGMRQSCIWLNSVELLKLNN